MIINLNPEFGLELTLGIPYAYWLHKQGKLEKVITCKGMKPFYYFCDNVEERYEHRTIDNGAAGLNSLPNNWIHHNAEALFGVDMEELTDELKEKANGVLDYSQWTPPPYKKHYSNDEIKLDKPFIVISNRYNIEHGKPPIGFFDIECLYKVFNYLTEKGYAVVYKRPKNTEFPLDQNEVNAINNGYSDITANVDGIGFINDYDLVGYYDDVFLLDDIIKKYRKDDNDVNAYNEIQLKLFSNANGFLTMGGGSSLLCSYFEKPNISYFTTGAECTRVGYFSSDNYYRKLSNHNFFPILDWEKNIDERGHKDYTEFMNKVKETF